MKGITLIGSDGTTYVDMSGKVLRTECAEAYGEITRVDLAEWVTFYGCLPEGQLDILDLGCWVNGKYAAPELDYRLALAFDAAETSGPVGRGEEPEFIGLHVWGWYEDSDCINPIPGEPAHMADGFGVYGVNADGTHQHLFDCGSHGAALALAKFYGDHYFSPELPITDYVDSERATL